MAPGVRGRWSPSSSSPKELEDLAGARPIGAAELESARLRKLRVVGDRAKVEAGLREPKLGELVVLDAEGNPAR